MNITPIEIRQKEFERHFRGYDKDEVNAFLHTLSQAWERVLQENREKSVKLAQAEKDIEKVREVEGSLFRTLRTAEDTSSEIITKAERTAEETRQAAERYQQEMLDNADARANAIVSGAEAKADAIVRGVRERVEQLKQEAEEAESRRQYALAQLEELAQRMLQQVENAQQLPMSDTIEESERLLAEAEQNIHARTGQSSEVETNDAAHDADEPTYPLESDDEHAPKEAPAYSPDEDTTLERAEEPEEAYEPAWASDESEAASEPTPAKLKRGSFFDEID